MCVCVCVFVCVFMYVCMHVCMYVCMYIGSSFRKTTNILRTYRIVVPNVNEVTTRNIWDHVVMF